MGGPKAVGSLGILRFKIVCLEWVILPKMANLEDIFRFLCLVLTGGIVFILHSVGSTYVYQSHKNFTQPINCDHQFARPTDYNFSSIMKLQTIPITDTYTYIISSLNVNYHTDTSIKATS